MGQVVGPEVKTERGWHWVRGILGTIVVGNLPPGLCRCCQTPQRPTGTHQVLSSPSFVSWSETAESNNVFNTYGMISSNLLLRRRSVSECLFGCIACNVLPVLKPPEVRGGVVPVRCPVDGNVFTLTKKLLGFSPWRLRSNPSWLPCGRLCWEGEK